MKGIVFSLLLIGCVSTSYAQRIYTWVDENGVTHFDESPRSSKAVTVDVKEERFAKPPQPVAEVPVSSVEVEKKALPEIIMYGAAWCGVCKRARRFFRDNDIRYTEYDVDTTAKGKRDYKKLNGSGVPIFLVDGQRYNGFSPSRFKSILER
jgi:glutaredoxin